MYSVALILACVTTTVLTETTVENADSQATIRALLNDLKAAKATNERQNEAFDAVKATLDAAKVTIETQDTKLKAHAANSKAQAAKTVTNGNSDLGAPARCESVHEGYTAGKKKCPIGKYQAYGAKVSTKDGRWPSSCPDGIGWQGVYFDHDQRGGICEPWTGSVARNGALFCEKHTCTNPKTGLPSAAYTYPFAKSGQYQYSLRCRPPGISPYKGVCDKTDNKAFCDKSGAPTVCLKMQVIHVDGMSRSAGVLLLKRSSCDSRTGKCPVFKAGLCIDLRKNYSVWTSSVNNRPSVVSISDVKGGMIKQAKRFGGYAKRLLKKYKNKLPKKYRCSDHRHKFKYQKKGRRKWIYRGMSKDATLARFAILNF